MAPLITRIARTVVPRRGPELGDCLVCTDSVRDDGEAVRLPRGGYVHRECTTYRMRRRGVRPLRARSRQRYDDFTGE